MVLALFSIVFYLALLRSIAFWVSYVQRKQYRLDRLWLSFQEASFWKLFWSKQRIAYAFLFVLWQLFVRLGQSGIAFDLLFIISGLFFLADTTLAGYHLYKRKLELPVRTAKSIGLFIAALVVNMMIARLAWLSTAYQWRFDIVLPEHALLLVIVQPLIVSAVFAIAFFPNSLLQRLSIYRATKKRSLCPNLTVIGVTGSVGKTSVKEYLAHFLSQKFHVLKTPEHVNVDTGVAKQILAELNPTHRYYVVEMGAYRPGEIASICAMVKPDYGIITALGNQHLELFGSPAALRDAKFELVQAVENPQHVFMNHESERLRLAAQQKQVEPIWYGFSAPADMVATKPIFSESGIECTIGTIRFQFPGFGTARLLNALGAITVANALGLSFAELSESAKTLPLLAHTNEVMSGKNGALLIDSTYNASLESVVQASADLAYVSRTKKLIVFKEIIELGAESRSVHEQCAEAFAQSQADLVLLPSSSKETMLGRLRALGVPASRIHDERALSSLVANANEQTVVLALGRDTQPLLAMFKQEKV